MRSLLTVCAFIWGVYGVAPAQGAELLVVGDQSRPYYASFLQGMEEADGGFNISTISDNVLRDRQQKELPRADVIVAIGHRAATTMQAMRPSVPVVYSLVSTRFADAAIRDNEIRRPSAFLTLEQPISRVLALISVALPERRRLGVIYGPTSITVGAKLRQQALAAGFQLYEEKISSETEINDALKRLTKNVNVLLALPDPVVVNENTAKSLILGSYLHEVALVGVSHAVVKAGALMAVHTTPAQFGRNSAELATKLVSERNGAGTDIEFPRYFDVTVNYQVAKGLGLELPSEDILYKKIRQRETTRHE